MAVRETPAARIERLLGAGDSAGALAASDDLLRQAPNSFLGRLGRARANTRLGNFIDAEKDLALALKLSPNDEQARMLRANLDLRLGKTDEALEGLRFVQRLKGPEAVEAAVTELLTLHGAGRNEEFVRVAKAGGIWTKDQRADLILARVAVIEDQERGIEELKRVFRSRHHWPLRRYAGFEAVGLLDRLKRYREAFDLASEVHRDTTAPLDMEPWIAPLEQQWKLLDRSPAWYRPRAKPVAGVAFIAGMPRSGTTLLEQMLDRHPEIAGIGEYDGVGNIRRGLFSTEAWPRNPNAIPDRTYAALREEYLAGAALLRRPGATWTLDKCLHAFRSLPEIAMLFPGAVCLRVERDPRDTAISIFLSHLNPSTFGWSGNLALIRKVIDAERRTVPRALEVLGLSHESIVYERLVDDPAGHAERCLARMGLAMDARVASPEGNTRTAATLSHAQVRQPINRRSIGRWQNYAWAFDSSWDALATAHDAHRRSR